VHSNQNATIFTNAKREPATGSIGGGNHYKNGVSLAQWEKTNLPPLAGTKGTKKAMVLQQKQKKTEEGRGGGSSHGKPQRKKINMLDTGKGLGTKERKKRCPVGKGAVDSGTPGGPGQKGEKSLGQKPYRTK